MTRKTWYTLGGVAATAVLASVFAIAHAQQPGPPAVDRSKFKIERPTESVLAKAFAAQAKGAVKAQVLAQAEADKALANPKVPPGKVTWHTDFAAACAASAKTGRPVLLFQMMGQLDNKFC